MTCKCPAGDACDHDGGVFDESAPAGRRWCKSPDHHEWLHMLLDRAKADLKSAYLVVARQASAMKAAGIELPPEPGDG